MTGSEGGMGPGDGVDPADEAFEARLRTLFAAQEAPPGTARWRAAAPARTAPRRRWPAPVLVAASVAVLLAGGAVIRARHGADAAPIVPGQVVTGPAPTGPTGPTGQALPTPTARRTSAAPTSAAPRGTPTASDSVPGGVTPRRALRSSGPVVASTPGQIVEGLDIAGGVTVRAAGVVVRDCRVRAGSRGVGVEVVSGSLTITDTEITGSTEAALAGDGWRARRLYVHDTGGDGVHLGSHVRLEDSRVEGITTGAALRATSGLTDVTLTGNTIDGGSGLAALFVAPDAGPDGPGPFVVTNNVLAGGNWTVYLLDGGNGRYHQRGYRVEGNRFGRGARYGPVDVTEPASSFAGWSGNIRTDTGAPVER